MTEPNPYKPPATHVADSIVHSDVVAYEPENAGFFFSTRVLLVVPPIMVTFGIGQSFAWLVIVVVLLVFGLVPGDRVPNRFGLPQGSRPIEPTSSQRQASPGFSVPGTGAE